MRAGRQAAKAEGNLAAKVLRDRNHAYWTATAWSNEAAMKEYMHSGVHGPVMKKLLEWCDEASMVHWMQDGAELPSWEQAHKRMQEEGRRSKVNHPSARHAAYVIPAPVMGVMREQRLK
jgi:hypothetical protein